MLKTGSSDLSFHVLLREWSRRREDELDEFRERIAGFLAIGLVLAVPLYGFHGLISGPEVSLVEPSEAAEPAAGATGIELPVVNPDAVLNRLKSNQLSRSDIRTVQARLKAKGFNPGPIDGIAGERTLSALNTYRQSIRLSPALAVNRESVSPLQDQ
jgi:Putative peptidoglycan binding domain